MIPELLAQLPASTRELLTQAIQAEVELARVPLKQEIHLLREQLRLLRIEKYGAKSEKLTVCEPCAKPVKVTSSACAGFETARAQLARAIEA